MPVLCCSRGMRLPAQNQVRLASRTKPKAKGRGACWHSNVTTLIGSLTRQYTATCTEGGASWGEPSYLRSASSVWCRPMKTFLPWPRAWKDKS